MIIAVLDADGRIAENAYLRLPRTSTTYKPARCRSAYGCTTGKRGLLARMQDLEFITFTEIFQRACQRVGSVGLGGNGQFARLTRSKTWVKLRGVIA